MSLLLGSSTGWVVPRIVGNKSILQVLGRVGHLQLGIRTILVHEYGVPDEFVRPFDDGLCLSGNFG